MIDQLLTYSPRDFIPYSSDIFFQTYQEELLQSPYLLCLIIILNLMLIFTFCKRKLKWTCFCCAALWSLYSFTFFYMTYSQLSWASSYFFNLGLVQVLIFIFIGLKKGTSNKAHSKLSIFLLLFGYLGTSILFWPLLKNLSLGHLPSLNEASSFFISFSVLLQKERLKIALLAAFPMFIILNYGLLRLYVFHTT